MNKLPLHKRVQCDEIWSFWLINTLIDDAKMLLHSGKHNHEKPAAGDHARAIAKARAAIGYAEAAEILARK